MPSGCLTVTLALSAAEGIDLPCDSSLFSDGFGARVKAEAVISERLNIIFEIAFNKKTVSVKTHGFLISMFELF